jgi:tetratricopeptide (TPR) repeat protein
MREPEKNIYFFKKAKETDSQDAEPIKALEQVCKELGRYVQSIRYYMKAIRMDHEDYYIYSELAEVYLNKLSYKKACLYSPHKYPVYHGNTLYAILEFPL